MSVESVILHRTCLPDVRCCLIRDFSDVLMYQSITSLTCEYAFDKYKTLLMNSLDKSLIDERKKNYLNAERLKRLNGLSQ